MKSLVGLTMTLLLLGACTQAQQDKTQQSINNPPPPTQLNTTNVSDQTKTDQGKHIGTEYGGKGAGYGQVKKIEGQAVPPIIEAPALTNEQKLNQLVYERIGRRVASVDILANAITINLVDYSVDSNIWWDDQQAIVKAVNELYGNSYDMLYWVADGVENKIVIMSLS